jgi:hypothetical protein
LLAITALAEGATGLCLLLLPGLVLDLLLGPGAHSGEALFMARVAGAAVAGIAVASPKARGEETEGPPAGLLAGLLTYNIGATLLLGYGGAVLGFVGVLLWPATAAHAGLAIRSAVCLRARGSGPRGP